ncbi:MAG: hypothetical protein HY795_14320 [Desulfovibrio sp.]|jgi:hypothetical protein|nr:hypothetical protein [Desulfovibrio sp.]MBI4959526.1 hypothetical protein [Desulfovibrio sp.]
MPYDIRLVKIINGETVLGKFDEATQGLKEVAILQTVPTQQGVQMVLLPFGYPFETEIGGEIKPEHILYTFKTFPEELKNKYLEATSNLTISSARDLSALNRMAPAGKGGSGLILK